MSNDEGFVGLQWQCTVAVQSEADGSGNPVSHSVDLSALLLDDRQPSRGLHDA